MTNDESVEWVTVKIHEQVRDTAREDSRTYTEIMQAGLDTDADTGEMDFEDWWSADYAQTIAHHVTQELADQETTVTLEATEYAQIADEVEGRMR